MLSGRNHDGIGRTIQHAVVDNELGDIVACDIGHESRHDRRWIREYRRATGWYGRQVPLKDQRITRIAIRIAGRAAIQLDRIADIHHLVGPRIGYRAWVNCCNRYRIRYTVREPVIDDELRDVDTCDIRDEGRHDGSRIGQCRCATRWR